MDMKTGTIARFESVTDARRANHTLPLTEEKAEQLLPLEPAARISVAKQWVTAERRERKAKRKAQRAARKAGRR